MKRYLLILLLFIPIWVYSQTSPAYIKRVPNSSTTFVSPVQQGTLIYDIQRTKLYQALTGLAGTSSLSSLTEWIDYVEVKNDFSQFHISAFELMPDSRYAIVNIPNVNALSGDILGVDFILSGEYLLRLFGIADGAGGISGRTLDFNGTIVADSIAGYAKLTDVEGLRDTTNLRIDSTKLRLTNIEDDTAHFQTAWDSVAIFHQRLDWHTDSLLLEIDTTNAHAARLNALEADSANWLHWSDTIAKIATKYDIDTLSASGIGGATKALNNLASVAINASLLPGTSDAIALGSTSKMWSDLFLASGGVINWDNGNVTLTHSADRLSLNGIFLTDSLIHGRDGISVFSSEAGKTEHRITMDASNADDMRIYAYDLTSSEYKPLTIGGDTTTIINDSLKVNGGANFGDSVLFAKPLIISSPSSGVSEAIKFKNTLGNSHSGISAYSQDESNSILLIGSNLYISGGSLARYDLTEAGSYIVMEGGDMYWGTVTSAGVNNSSMLISETGDLTVYKKATFQTVDHASTDLDKFAAFTAGGELQYRTGAELLSDIGGQASITPQNVTTGSNKITLGGTPTGASLQAFSIDVDQSKIDHNSLLNYVAAKHFYQNAIDTVHTTLTGLLKATSGVLSAASAGTDYQAPLTNPVTGTGTENTLTKFTGTSTVGNSSITDNGSLVTLTTPLLATSFQSSTNDVLFGNTSTTSEYMKLYYNGGTGYVSLRYNGTDVFSTNSTGVSIPTGKIYQINGNDIIQQTITNGVTTSAPSQDIVYDNLATKADKSMYAHQSLTMAAGASSWDCSAGQNATLAITGNVTLTMTNLIAGTSGNLTIAAPAGAYTVTIAHASASIKISPSIRSATATFTVSGGAYDVYSWYYDGTYLLWNGTKGYY
jgi:hypothetical protein